MEISVNTGYFIGRPDGSKRTMAEALGIMKAGGFDCADIGLGSDDPAYNPVVADDPDAAAKALRETFARVGIKPDQAHARYDFKDYAPAAVTEHLVRTVKVCGALGVRTLVVHADTWYDVETYTFDRALARIYEIHAPVVEEAEKRGVVIAMENLFEDRAPKGSRCRFCSEVEELEAIVAKFPTPFCGVCYDTGHARVVYGDKQFEVMARFGKRIVATHVHDNIASKDLHGFPFSGGTDWEAFRQMLLRIGYTGTFTFEMVYGRFPDELVTDFATFLHKAGVYMTRELG